MRIHWLRKAPSFLILGFLVFLTSCKQSVDLDALKTLATTTAASADSYSALSADFYTSCVRMWNWQWIAARSHARFPSLDDACGTNQIASHQWQAANLVLLSYIRALGALAGGNDNNSDFGIPKLIEAVNGTGQGLSSAQSTAISNAATAIVADIYNLRRRAAISETAPKAQSDLNALASALQAVAKVNYSTQLDLETDAIDHFYAPVSPEAVGIGPSPTAIGAIHELRSRAKSEKRVSVENGALNMRSLNATLSDFDKVQLLTLRDQYRRDRAAVQERRSAINAYVRSLQAINATHQNLVDAIANNRPADIAKIVQAYIDEFAPDIRAIDAAFKGSNQ